MPLSFVLISVVMGVSGMVSAAANEGAFPQLIPVAVQPPTALGPLGATLPFTLDIDDQPVRGILEVPELTYEMAPIEYRAGSEPSGAVKQPGLHKYSIVSFKRLAFTDDFFSNWSKAIFQARSYEQHYRSITYNYPTNEREEAESHKLTKCLMQRYKPYIPYKAAGSEVAMEEVTIRCEELGLDLEELDRRER